MKDIPKHILVTVIIMVVVGLLGGGAWYWSSGQLAQKLEEKTGLEGQILAIEKKGIFPSAQNKKILDDQKTKLSGLEEALKPDLQGRMELFAAVRTIDPVTGSMKGLDPDSWKKVFGDKRQELRQLAKDKNMSIPEEYNFAFKSYVLAAPRAEHTLDLGVQLLAIEEITKLLAAAGVESVSSIKRTIVEETRSGPGGGGSAAGNDEGINAKVLTGPENTYRVLPFEVSLKSDPASVIEFLNGLGSSKLMFVTRFVYLENEKNSVPKRSEITGAGSATGATPEQKKNFISVAGQEKVNARIRLDLIDFLPAVADPKKPVPKP